MAGLVENWVDNAKQQRVPVCAKGVEFYDEYDSEAEIDSIEDTPKFSHMKLQGRKSELQLLHDVYEFVQRQHDDTVGNQATQRDNDESKQANPTRSSEKSDDATVVMIRGLSGTGKTTLVRKFFEELRSMRSADTENGFSLPFLLSGKFDEFSRADPFSAIAGALGNFIKNLVKDQQAVDASCEKNEIMRLRKAIADSLGQDEVLYLTTIIPELRLVTCPDGNADFDTPVSGRMSISKENAWNRLKFIFRIFFAAMSSMQHPVVFFLDDLHWCDPASLELLQALLLDKQLKSVMFIGSYRTDEIGEQLSNVLKRVEFARKIVQIETEDVSMERFVPFIQEALRLEDTNKSQAFAKQIHRKTHGNIFFTLQTLEDLRKRKILTFSRLTFEWEWSVEGIDLDEVLYDDVLAVMSSKIQEAPARLQRLLILAAYSRASLEFDTLWKLVELDGEPITQSDMDALLEQAVSEDFFVKDCKARVYRFSHDKIQQAAYNVIPTGSRRQEFRCLMGHRLYEMGSSSNGEEWMIFAAVDHWNAGDESEQTEFMIERNFEAGKMAAEKVAYDSAVTYLQRSKELLLRDKDAWQGKYAVCLRVWELLGEVELCQGYLEKGTKTAEEIFANAKNLSDTLYLKHALSKALARARKHAEAAELCCATLRDLGTSTPSKFVMFTGLVRDFLYLKRCFSRLSNEDILNLPIVEDEPKVMIMSFRLVLAHQFLLVGDLVEYMALTLRVLRMTFDYGLFKDVTTTFAQFGLACDMFGDLDLAARSNELSMQMVVKTNAPELECHPYLSVMHWFRTWDTSTQELSGQFFRGVSVGMKAGEVEPAFLIAFSGCFNEYVSGYNLGILELKFLRLIEKVDLYHVDTAKPHATEALLSIQHLRGTTATTDFASLLSTIPEDGLGLSLGCIARLQVGFYFGDFSFSKRVMDKLLSKPYNDTSHSYASLQYTFIALVSASLFRLHGKRSYLSRARKYYKKLLHLSKRKGMNSWHRVLLMEAHICASSCRKRNKKKINLALELYDQAIEAAATHGCVQDAALGSQLSAEFRLTMASEGALRNQGAQVAILLSKARDWYKAWGAKSLIRHLENKFRAQFMISSEVPTLEDRSSLMMLSENGFETTA